MPVLALVVLGLSLVLIAAALTTPAQAAIASSSEAGQGGAGDPAGLELEPLAAADPEPRADPGAGSGLFESLGVDVSGGAWTIPPRGVQYAETIRQAEQQYGLPENLLARTLYEESRFRPEIIDGTIRSSAGAIGIAQFMPATARGAGIDPTDPQQAIPAAARELRAMFNKFGTWSKALVAYNWGQGNLGRKGIGATPAETDRYVDAITRDVGLPGATWNDVTPAG
jgi:hypothetical protein